MFYQRPWMGGKWGVREAIDYMMTVDFAILDTAAVRRESLLRKAWETARSNIDTGTAGGPFAYIVPEAGNALEMLKRLRMGGVDMRRAKQPFTVNGKTYAPGTWVIPAGQAFRGYVVDLMEPQRYPELRSGITGPTKKPYDVAGWTLPMLMGVAYERVDKPFTAELETAEPIPSQTTPCERSQMASNRSL